MRVVSSLPCEIQRRPRDTERQTEYAKSLFFVLLDRSSYFDRLLEGLKVCTSCQEVMKRAESRSEWKSTRDRAGQLPVVGYERRLVKARQEVAQAVTDFSRLVATLSPDAPTACVRAEVLFKEIQETKEDLANLQLWKGSETQRNFVENLLRSVDEFVESSWEEFTASKKTMRKEDREPAFRN